MKARSCRLAVEAADDRLVPRTGAYGNFNNDGLVDVAAITTPTTLVVSLANPDGSDPVSATLTAPKTRPMQDVYLCDHDGDGNLDVTASGSSNGVGNAHIWLGNGDGTFDP
jgi:hypothetical protein